jgi:TolB-like protein/Tfp pilus assembly protein PilF
VMDCGDAGHILLSRHVAEDLEQYPRWRSDLHDLGECEVKHGVRIHVVNLYTEEAGNPGLPEKFKQAAGVKRATPAVFRSAVKPRGPRWATIGGAILIIALVATGLLLFWSKRSPTAATALTTIPEKSIAVLPFENLSDEKQNAFFTDGVQDEILTDLARVADLKVISRTSVMQYKTEVQRNLRKIGEELGVAHVVEGSVQRAGNKVRVNAQLIDARNDAHLWAQTYDRDLADVFAIQSEIAKAIADQLQAKLSPNEKRAIEQPPTTNVNAFDLYSKAKTLELSTSFSALSGPNLVQAIDLLNQALAQDPSFILAQCQLAYAHDNLYFLNIDHTPARLALADAAVQQAVRLSPESGDAHLARANHLYCGYLDYDGALAELEMARRSLPNDPRVFELTGYIYRRQGKSEEGLRSLQRSLELDPRNYFTHQQIALSYDYLHQFAAEAAALDRAVSIKPDDPEINVIRGVIELSWKADTRPLHKIITEMRRKNPADLKDVADNWFLLALAERDIAGAEAALAALGDNTFGDDAFQFSSRFCQGLIGQMTNDGKRAAAGFAAARAEQEKVVDKQPNYGPAVGILALIDAALGRKEDALREGRRAIELLSATNDSIDSSDMVAWFAVIAAWLGEKDLACEQLEKAKQFGTDITYGRLKLLPWWDPLRGDPRFDKIVASLAPKDTTSSSK